MLGNSPSVQSIKLGNTNIVCYLSSFLLILFIKKRNFSLSENGLTQL